ncbi:MAG: hypothetical protein K2G91_09050 [Prevotella sp.]|nr:hypothetical protein [Prevotella sp.]
MKTLSYKIFVLSVMLVLSHGAKAQKAIVLPVEYAKITLQSYPEGAKVYHNGKLICTSTPATVEIPFRGLIVPGSKKDLQQRMRRSAEANSMELVFVQDGYAKVVETITPTITQVGKNKYDFEWPKSVIGELREKRVNTPRADVTAPKNEEKKKVSRENAGQTSLERTIIRWYFESDPPGSRVFWRVISSVPAEVKNTNETYLGTTPYEDTRSFNIQGLSYENSRDVQIEIKLRRKGFMDQTKRFNVRQAIDQQEISSFFDLVKVDEEE